MTVTETTPVSERQFRLAMKKLGLDKPKIVTWADGSDAEIAKMVAAADEGVIDLSDYWTVGDTRKVKLAAMEATGVREDHVAQEVEFVLMNAGGKTLGNAVASGRTECSFVVGQKDCLAHGTYLEAGYMHDLPEYNTDPGGWDGCARRTWCNSIYREAVPSGIRGIFKPFLNVTAAGAGSETKTSIDYFALPAEKEVFGTDLVYGAARCADETAESSLSQFEWYETEGNRFKKAGPDGKQVSWWTRSPYRSSGREFCALGSGGTDRVLPGHASADTIVQIGIAPLCCI